VILGVSEGTGAAIARAVSRDLGLSVFGVHRGRHQPQADALEQEIKSLGRRAVFSIADASTVDGAERGAEAILAAAGPRSVRLLVHSLASASLGLFASGDQRQVVPRQIHRTFEVMAHSFVYWTQAILASDLLAPSARLLGLGNTLSESMIHNCGLVAASKAALEMYVRCLALELGPRGHRVNLLKFPTVNTPAVRKVYGEDAMDRIERVHRQMTPAGRMCTVEEVARFTCVLAGEAGEWFNGATIDYTGGMTLALADLLLHPHPDSTAR